MSDVVTRRNDCRMCHGLELDLVLPLAPSPLPDAYVPAEALDEPQPSYPLDVYLCRSCGLAQLLDVVQPAAIYRDYIYETVSSLGLVEHFEEYADDVIARIQPAEGSLVIDVGSNDGTLLRAFRDRGYRVLGIDPAEELARRATEAGLETLNAFFDVPLARQIREERGPAAVITANNVLANIDDLDEVAAAARELLAPDGVFVFESFYLADLLRNFVFDFIYHEHVSAFSLRPLELFFPRHGLELIDAVLTPTKGGSLRCTVQHEGGARRVAPGVVDLREREEAEGIHRPETFADFRKRIDRAKREVLDLLEGLAADGTSLAGYGASATSTSLLHEFELGGLLDYLVDDYPAKQDLYSPGLHLPVVPSEALYERRPDTVVILAWRYADPIVARHQRYLDEGGRFIVPLPELRQL